MIPHTLVQGGFGVLAVISALLLTYPLWLPMFRKREPDLVIPAPTPIDVGPAPFINPIVLDPKELTDPRNLHVVACFFNFYRFKTPVENFKAFEHHMRALGVTLHVVELVLGDAPFQVTNRHDPHHLQLRTDTEFFQKENLINLGVKNIYKLYPDWRYMSWIDADITFFNKNVVFETMYLLQRHPVVQMWAKALDLGPDGVPIKPENQYKQEVVTSFGFAHQNQHDVQAIYGVYWHTGYAWAMRRDTYEALGGLYENTILGAADHHMAWAWIGQPERGIHGAASEGYKADARRWGSRAQRVVAGDVGYVPGMIHHQWHGRKEDRKYVERWDILVKNGFDPTLDLKREPDGLLKLTGRSKGLRDGIRAYFLQRNDDANTLA